MTGEREFDDFAALAAELGQPLTADEARSTAGMLRLLEEAPGVDEYLRVRVEIPRPPSGTLAYMVPRTRIYFNVSRCRQFWGDAMVALAVYASTQSAPATFFATTARKLYDNLALLSPDEATVVRQFFVQTGGRPYGTPVEESALRAGLAGTRVPIDAALDALEGRGVVRKRRPARLELVL